MSFLNRLLICFGFTLALAGCLTDADRRELASQTIDQRTLSYIGAYNQFIEQGNYQPDMVKLRESFRHTPWFHVSLTPAHALLWAKLNRVSADQDIKGCIELIEQALPYYFADLYLHNYAHYCYNFDSQVIKAEKHQQFTSELIYSILQSGTGDSLEQAYRVINTAEIFGFLRLVDLQVEKVRAVNASIVAQSLDAAAQDDVSNDTDVQLSDQVSDQASDQLSDLPKPLLFDDTIDVDQVFFYVVDTVDQTNQAKRQVWFAMQKPDLYLEPSLNDSKNNQNKSSQPKSRSAPSMIESSQKL